MSPSLASVVFFNINRQWKWTCKDDRQERQNKENIPGHVIRENGFTNFYFGWYKTKITNVVLARAKNDRKQMAQANVRVEEEETGS